MVDVTLSIGNSDIVPLLGRLDELKDRLADEMTTPNANDPKVRSATITHALAGRLCRELREHQVLVARLEKEHVHRR